MSDLKQRIQDFQAKFTEQLAHVDRLKDLEELQNQYLGRKRGVVKDLLGELRSAASELRPELGQLINGFKVSVEEALSHRVQELREKADQTSRAKHSVDLTLPGLLPDMGSLHPLNIVNRELVTIFERMGYEVASGPEIETDFYNFEALGIDRNHPARDMQDTFYVSDDVVLRTHTSNVQIHLMQERKPPFKAIMPGRVYRKDADITHSPMFHQVEALVVGENITFTDLKGTLDHFLKKLFGESTKMRLRPSFFPFTEPSAEVDVTCIMCGGEGCRVCKNSGWLEILGAGMVDPVVFKNVGYDPEVVSGFAFGLGIERVAMLKYGISDIRMFFENDLRFLSQFN